MSKRTTQVEPEVQILQLFNGLSDEAKRITLGLLKVGYNPQQVSQPASTTSDTKSGKKSRRASRLAEQIASTTIQRCTAVIDDKPCNEPQGHALHEDSTYANYHPFASGAQPAGRRSSRKSKNDESLAGSETETVDAASAAAGSGGD